MRGVGSDKWFSSVCISIPPSGRYEEYMDCDIDPSVIYEVLSTYHKYNSVITGKNRFFITVFFNQSFLFLPQKKIEGQLMKINHYEIRLLFFEIKT